MSYILLETFIRLFISGKLQIRKNRSVIGSESCKVGIACSDIDHLEISAYKNMIQARQRKAAKPCAKMF